MDRYLIISADCHAGLPDAEYAEYLDPKYQEAFDDDRKQRTEMRRQMATATGQDENEFVNQWYADNDERLRGGWDAAQRDAELDADGVAGEVIFPDADAVRGGASAPFGAGLGLSGQADPELSMAGARAHNRWLAELCRESPNRRIGLAIVPILHDIDGAVAEIRRAHESGLRGIMIPVLWDPYPAYHDARYDPIWAVCQELDLPLHTHTGPAPREDYGGNLGIYGAETIWWTARPMWFLLWSGVFERFPGLKFAVTEGGCWWAADMLWKWDAIYDREHATKKMSRIAPALSMRPSEYFDRNVWIGASTTRRREIARRHEIGIGNIMWGNDFPHPEGTWPNTRAWLRDTFWDCPVEDARRMLGDNAAEVYGLDVDALAPLVEKIGPTPEDLGQTADVDLSKWDAVAAAGRHWLTDREAVPVPPGADGGGGPA
ncbi:MAG: amidohydrolase [Myxococcales bacterium]|nr:amidohydrolase [Myxococcales bacterium]